MNYLVMDRASEAAANDLAEVRKLIESMNALVYSQIQQQQHALQQQKPTEPVMEELPNNHQEDGSSDLPPNENNTVEMNPSSNHSTTTDWNNSTDSVHYNTDTTIPQDSSDTSNSSLLQQQQQQSQNTQTYSAPISQAGVIVEVTHLTFNRVLYFQLTPEATIEPVIAWLRLSYQDAAISGMVLQYKGFDGLWKCLLNRDDSLRRILKQSMKGNTMLQMRIPRKEDLLSSGYTDQRLLALTVTQSIQ